jgi:DNA-binding YbaB/EbfC family protein
MTGDYSRLQEELRKAQAELETASVEASSGGGAITVTMSGTQECLGVSISPELLAEGDIERLEGLLLLAVNQAIKDSQLMAARRLSPFTDQMDR